MKRIFCILTIMLLVVLPTVSHAEVIVHDQRLLQPDRAFTQDDLNREINSKYSVMELPDGEHDGKEYGIIKFSELPWSTDSDKSVPIEWYILEKKNGQALLMSKHIVSYHSYDTEASTEWEKTKMKKHLKNILDGINSGDRAMMVPNPHRNVGQLFLLTIDEANYYFSGNRANLSYAYPTDAAAATGNTSAFWLENDNSLGGGFAPCVNGKTVIDTPNIEYAAATRKLGIRPCIIVKYEVNNELQSNLQIETSPLSGSDAANTASVFKGVTEVNSETQTYIYDTENDGVAKKFTIKIQLPVYFSEDPNLMNMLNNLVKTTGYDILKKQVDDYIEDNLERLKSQFTVSPGAIAVVGNNIYDIMFQTGNKSICNIRFDTNTGMCSAIGE